MIFCCTVVRFDWTSRGREEYLYRGLWQDVDRGRTQGGGTGGRSLIRQVGRYVRQFIDERYIIIIIIRQPLCPVVGRRHQHAVSKLACLVLSSAISCRSSIILSRSSLHRLTGLPCCIFLSHGLQVVTREVHRLSLRRLICPAQDHFIFLTVLIISMTFVLSLTQILVFLSLYVMLSILLSILVCAAARLLCACLVSVDVSAPYVIAGSTYEWYTCLFRQMARLLLKISRCLAYAAQPDMILRCISLSWFFSSRL